MKKIALIALIISSALLLQGCIVAVLGVGASTVKVATDPRTTGTQVDDTSLDSKISLRLKDEADYFKGSRIVASAYNGNVLLIGQAKSKAVIDRAEKLIQSFEGVNKIYNQVRVGSMVSVSTMTNDTWITTKVKTALIGNKEIKARGIKVVTENGEVFLMGIVSRDEGRSASDIASKIAGVKLVTTIFDYID